MSNPEVSVVIPYKGDNLSWGESIEQRFAARREEINILSRVAPEPKPTILLRRNVANTSASIFDLKTNRAFFVCVGEDARIEQILGVVEPKTGETHLRIYTTPLSSPAETVYFGGVMLWGHGTKPEGGVESVFSIDPSVDQDIDEADIRRAEVLLEAAAAILKLTPSPIPISIQDARELREKQPSKKRRVAS